jgi:hypothetical protein
MYNAPQSEDAMQIVDVREAYYGETISRITILSPFIQHSVRSILSGGTPMVNVSRAKLVSRATMIRFMAFVVLILAATSWAQTRPPIVEKVAKAYGLDSYGQVDAIRYTWSAEFPGVKVSHAWEWEPKTNKVTFSGNDKDGKPVTVTYVRGDSKQPDNVKHEIDPSFTNDNYWVLFPFHAYWDTSATITDQGMRKLPIGAGSADLMSVKYPAEVGGYTPGDTWDLYLGKDNRVVQFVYHRGGDKKPGVVSATWTGYKTAGPLVFSTEHRGTADGKPLHIFVSNVAVKLAGSGAWVEAK